MTREDQLKQRKQWEVRVRDFRASGKTAVAWCSEQQVKPHQLKYGMKQYEKPITYLHYLFEQWPNIDLNDPDALEKLLPCSTATIQ